MLKAAKKNFTPYENEYKKSICYFSDKSELKVLENTEQCLADRSQRNTLRQTLLLN
jgi:hypothetical protein